MFHEITGRLVHQILNHHYIIQAVDQFIIVDQIIVVFQSFLDIVDLQIMAVYISMVFGYVFII